MCKYLLINVILSLFTPGGISMTYLSLNDDAQPGNFAITEIGCGAQ